MNIEEFRAYCLSKEATSESTPFDETTLVFKVAGKMFALTGITHFEYINLKCDPERAQELRADYEAVRPGYHMSKKHWNSVYLHEHIPQDLVLELIDHSYELVLSSLPKKVQTVVRAGRFKDTFEG